MDYKKNMTWIPNYGDPPCYDWKKGIPYIGDPPPPPFVPDLVRLPPKPGLLSVDDVVMKKLVDAIALEEKKKKQVLEEKKKKKKVKVKKIRKKRKKKALKSESPPKHDDSIYEREI